MFLRDVMHIVLSTAEGEVDLELAVGAEATVADLLQALPGRRSLPSRGLVVAPAPAWPNAAGGALRVHRLDPSLRLATAGLRHGATLRSDGGPGPAPPVVAGGVELRLVGGVAAGGTVPLAPGAHVLGRAADVAIDHPTVSARHARLVVGPQGCTVEDLGSRNGTRLEGEFVLGPRPLSPGQVLELGAVQLTVLPRPSPGRDSCAPDEPWPSPGQFGTRPVGSRPGTVAYNRPPRLGPPPPPAPVALPAPEPELGPAVRFGWAALLVPLVLGAVVALFFGPLMAAFVLFTPVMVVANWLEDRRRRRNERAAGRHRIMAATHELEVALAAARSRDVARNRALHPDPAETLHTGWQSGPRLWERRLDHPDAMRLSLGIADVPWEPPLQEGPGVRPPEVSDVLSRYTTLPRCPVPLDLAPGRIVGLVGRGEPLVALARSLVCQAAVHHGPSDVRIAVLAGAGPALAWDWAKWLPHTRGLQAAGAEQVESVVRRLLEEGPGERSLTAPMTLAVVDGDGLTDGRTSPARQLLAAGRAGRVAVAGVVLSSTTERLPSSCDTVVEIGDEHGMARRLELGTGSSVEGVLVGGVPEPAARACARSLAGLDDPEADLDGGRLPERVLLLDLVDMGRPSAVALEARWRGAEADSLVVTVGVSEDGPLRVDLVRDGPHALVAGTTGSGKSQLLRSVVAGLAASYSPEDLTFVLIDYKGGSAFSDCARLPHVVGMVTDLDDQLARRALRCLEAELKHREARLAAAGAADLPAFHALRARRRRNGGRPPRRRPGAVEAPLPRLLVVIDELATLTAELPDFVDALVDIAQRGRSLGMHLLLATQRPSGTVSHHIQANTNLRVALRVQDGADSTDVVGTPAAAHLDRRRPGRGYLRTGHGEVVAFQAALVGERGPGRAPPVQVRPFTFGQTQVPWRGQDPEPATSDLSELVDAAVASARSMRIDPPRRPWPDPLPERVILDDLPTRAVGTADEPDLQRQSAFVWEPAAGNLLLVGVAGSGTTTALATLALVLARAHRPDDLHMYALDFGSGALAPLARLPHVGGVVLAGERERHERLMRMLRGHLQQRRRAIAVGSRQEWPMVVLLVDNLGGLHAAWDDLAGSTLRQDLVTVLADGPSLGVAVAATADRPGAVPSAVTSLAPNKLVFRLAESHDYASFGLGAGQVPPPYPGRAVDVSSGREVQVALPSGRAAPEGGLAAAVAAVAAATEAGRRPPGVATLPEQVGLGEVLGSARLAGPEWFLPVGIGDEALAPVGMVLAEGDHALVAGPARSGKSTVLRTVAAVVAHHRPDVRLTAVCPRPSPLLDAPVDEAVTGTEAVGEVLARALDAAGPEMVLVDDAELVDDPGGSLSSLLARRRPGVHVVAAGRADALRTAYGHWVAEVRRSRQGLALRPHADLDGDLWHAELPRRRAVAFGPGRGYLVGDGRVELVQAVGP